MLYLCQAVKVLETSKMRSKFSYSSACPRAMGRPGHAFLWDFTVSIGHWPVTADLKLIEPAGNSRNPTSVCLFSSESCLSIVGPLHPFWKISNSMWIQEPDTQQILCPLIDEKALDGMNLFFSLNVMSTRRNTNCPKQTFRLKLNPPPPKKRKEKKEKSLVTC